jgi:hypothetical protein
MAKRKPSPEEVRCRDQIRATEEHFARWWGRLKLAFRQLEADRARLVRLRRKLQALLEPPRGADGEGR